MAKKLKLPVVLIPPSRLDAGDAQYHATVLQQIERLQQELAAAQAAANLWGQYLVKKYALANGDAVQADGVIERRT